MEYKTLKKKVLNLKSTEDFEPLAIEIFNFQYANNKVYQDFCKYLKLSPQSVDALEKIPFLPIEFFKSHKILSVEENIKSIFTSSGTTGMQTSKHFITDIDIYEQVFTQIFEQFYGKVEDYAILALLPSYLERDGSSLIYMVNDLIQQSNNTDSGFYLNNQKELYEKLLALEAQQQKTLLIGVSFALLDFVENYSMNLKHTTIMETGGMKGRRKEIIREELHSVLKAGFGVEAIHSEYGMTELLSQAYSKGNGIFELPNTMNILIRDVEDPLTIYTNHQKTGGINVVDLANIHSCAFIATKDLGRIVKKNQLEILGRFDNSDVRGCNLLTL
jgi:phenylacetate-coenzyme A ligase PaaK-like adenylate-forming protein